MRRTAGLFLFISYYFQTYGLKYTTASKNAFINDVVCGDRTISGMGG